MRKSLKIVLVALAASAAASAGYPHAIPLFGSEPKPVANTVALSAVGLPSSLPRASTFSDLARPEAHRHPTAELIDWEAVRQLSNVVGLNNVVALQRVEASRHRASQSGPSGTGDQRAVPASTFHGPGFAKGWDCVATAETGGNWSMTGSDYSSALGVMNQAVRENAPPDVAAKILSGTATRDEQIAMASSIVAKHGVTAWGARTVAKCA